MCWLAKAGWSARWQSLHRAGTSFLSRNSDFPDACGSWQPRQLPATGACLNLTWEMVFAISAWQPVHRSLPAAIRLDLFREACGSWQRMHSPARTGAWTLRAFSGTSPVWQLEQIAVASAARSLPCEEAWGS